MAEMVSVDRPSDDSDEQNAKSADELDDLTLGERKAGLPRDFGSISTCRPKRWMRRCCPRS